ncbi:MAG TPA: hypothetical protein VK465_04035 [Fibrobacteria bacterium]|nr:hypothetical protein [Fibrobacteria bacterium]
MSPAPTQGSSALASSSPSAKHVTGKVRCIVTVHGMGEPKLNSTLMPVAERIAQAAYPELRGDTLTLGGISSLAGIGDPKHPSFIPCIQLRDISIPRAKDSRGPVILRPSTRGENLLFADIHWSDITREAFPKVGDALPHWIACLIHRVERKRMQHAGPDQRWWVEDMLYLLRRTILFAERVLSLRAKELSDVVFGRYLGDVQLYGEWAPCRGTAVRLFHDRMAGIHTYLRDTLKVEEVEYTVIAHSLGTVLSLDALMLAHAYALHKQNDQEAADALAAQQLPFPGYTDVRPLPDPAWIDSVKAFVTLGSPIDKFLTLWWYNYGHMADDTWMRKHDEGKRIRHYNFCDEQDPVGHKLDFLRGAKAFRAAFDCADGKRFLNDVVYNHTPIPGYAHVSYWTDHALFDLLYRRVLVDGPQDLTREDLETFEVYRPKVYFFILLIHYYLVPVLVLVPAYFSLTWAIFSDSWHAKILGMLAFILSLTYGRTVLMLNVGWRRALKQTKVDDLAVTAAAAPGKPARGFFQRLARGLLESREAHASIARKSWWILAAGGFLGSYLLFCYLWEGHQPLDPLRQEGTPILLVSAALFSLLLVIFSRLERAKAASRLQESLVDDRRWAWWREPFLVLLMCLPPFLPAWQPAQEPGLHVLDWICRSFGHCLDGASRNALLWVAIPCQLSALVWMQVIWHHRWMKRRFMPQPGEKPEDYAWQRDFNVYAKD